MSSSDLLHPLRERPRDAYEWTDDPSTFDCAIYRLGLRVLVPIPGLPASFRVADIDVELVDGPVLAQQTQLRQRHGFPLTFDKHMSRRPVGGGEQILLLSKRYAVTTMVEVEGSMLAWRAAAEGAAGALASVLDERIAGEVLLEDVVLQNTGRTVGAADVRERVRTFLPLEVTALDRPALAALADLDLTESGVGRAGRLLRRATLEGPTADAYVMLFVAAESVLETRQPSKREFDAVLEEAGINPHGLPLHTGLLISLRGQIVHEGLEDHERLRIAYYEMEAIVKILIRRAAALDGGWWPAHGPAAYAADFDARSATSFARRTEWHTDGLPARTLPGEERVPRRVARPAEPLLVRLDSSVTDALPEDEVSLLSRTVADAQAWVDPDGPALAVHLGRPSEVTSGADITFNGESLWIAPDRVTGSLDEARPELLVNLVWDVHAAVGSMLVLRAGIESAEDGVAFIEAVGAFHQYTRLVTHGDFDGTALTMPPEPVTDHWSIGKIAGWAAAGSSRAAQLVGRQPGRTGNLGRDLAALLSDSSPLPPRPRI